MLMSLQWSAGELDDEAAADVAAYVAAVRGAGAAGTTAAECRSLSPAFLADVWQVRAEKSSWVQWQPSSKRCLATCGGMRPPRLHALGFYN